MGVYFADTGITRRLFATYGFSDFLAAGFAAVFATDPFWHRVCPQRDWSGYFLGPEKHTNIKEYVPEAGFDVLPAVSGRRAPSHD